MSVDVITAGAGLAVIIAGVIGLLLNMRKDSREKIMKYRIQREERWSLILGKKTVYFSLERLNQWGDWLYVSGSISSSFEEISVKMPLLLDPPKPKEETILEFTHPLDAIP